MFWILFESYVLCLFQHTRRYFWSADLWSCLTNWCIYLSQRCCTFIAISIVTSPKVEHIAALMCPERRLLSKRKKCSWQTGYSDDIVYIQNQIIVLRFWVFATFTERCIYMAFKAIVLKNHRHNWRLQEPQDLKHLRTMILLQMT